MLGLLQSKKIGHTNELNLSEEFYEYFNVQKRNALKEDNEEQGDLEEKENEEIKTQGNN